jgi:hypothetical protein
MIGFLPDISSKQAENNYCGVLRLKEAKQEEQILITYRRISYERECESGGEAHKGTKQWKKGETHTKVGKQGNAIRCISGDRRVKVTNVRT